MIHAKRSVFLGSGYRTKPVVQPTRMFAGGKCTAAVNSLAGYYVGPGKFSLTVVLVLVNEWCLRRGQIDDLTPKE